MFRVYLEGDKGVFEVMDVFAEAVRLQMAMARQAEVVQAVELDVNLTLTLLIEDVNDETPDVVLGESVHIPEELPVGFIIGGVFTATDRDANDNLTYSLEGDDSKYLSVLHTGLMRVERRIDRDGPNGRKKLDKLTLGVEDAAHHKSTFSLTIIVTDINDNVPTCASGFFSKIINRTTSSDASVINIPCTDDDDGSNGQFSLRIVPRSQSKDHRKRFRLKAFDLFADVDTLRRESSGKESSVYILTILAVDTPKQGRANTGTAVVVVNFTHLNEYTPQWKSPVPDINHNFPSVALPESTSPGTVVNTLVADDKDPETVVTYTIASVTDDNSNNITGLFTINSNSGELTSTGKLDCDPQTGGAEYYTILVMATDGKHNISGNVKIIVKNTNDNVPVFNKSVQTISVKAVKSVAVPFVDFDVYDQDKSSDVTLDLEKGDRQYFQLSKESAKWQLKFQPGIDPQKNPDIPPVIRVTANDNGDPPLTSEATVVLTDLPCHVTTPSPSSAVPPLRRRRCSWPSTLPMTSTPQMVAGKTDSSSSLFGSPVCQPSSASQEDSKTGLYLKIACAAEGVIIVMATLFIMAKKCGWYVEHSSLHPHQYIILFKSRVKGSRL
ncbi:protocadherin Fat 2-like [Haliotis rubra]|uniref:protocadherin Fat 2-like n=1 Tax=Haliotis rubra TaxID=36100 RepID=UPI001EE53DC7|nr:protocadherin Fat 2-like [Haliotis rubra]